MKTRDKLIVALSVVVLVLLVILLATKVGNRNEILPQTEGVVVVPTMQDAISQDSTWCGTFQLVWNDLKNELVKGDIVYSPQEPIAESLNKETYTQNMLSEAYYYKKWGLMTLDLKAEIEKGIKEKFEQTSDILDEFDWPEEPEDYHYFLYTMLYRKFEFEKVFDVLSNGPFGSQKVEAQYFGIDSNTQDTVGEQVEVLYYHSSDDFAVLLNTKSEDEVILVKNPSGSTFEEIYQNMQKKKESFQGSTRFGKQDELKVPYLHINEKKEYTEFEEKTFPCFNPELPPYGKIIKAMQTVQFSIDETGGKVKSEAGIDVVFKSAPVPKDDKPRLFYVDDTFAIFLREKGRNTPYFAGRIEDISKFQ